MPLKFQKEKNQKKATKSNKLSPAAKRNVKRAWCSSYNEEISRKQIFLVKHIIKIYVRSM